MRARRGSFLSLAATLALSVGPGAAAMGFVQSNPSRQGKRTQAGDQVRVDAAAAKRARKQARNLRNATPPLPLMAAIKGDDR